MDRNGIPMGFSIPLVNIILVPHVSEYHAINYYDYTNIGQSIGISCMMMRDTWAWS